MQSKVGRAHLPRMPKGYWNAFTSCSKAFFPLDYELLGLGLRPGGLVGARHMLSRYEWMG